MNRYGIILIFVLGWNFGFTQFHSSERDSVLDAEIREKFYYKTKFVFDLSHERTLLTAGVNVKMNVLRIGVQYQKKYKFGLYYAISRTYETYEPIVPEVNNYQTNILGWGGFFEYVMIENYRWYLGTPFAFGQGWVSGLAFDEDNNRIAAHDYSTDRFGMFSLGANGGYNVNYWLGLYGGVGFRFTNGAGQQSTDRLTTPFYSYGVKVKIGHFFTTIFHHKRVLRMKSIYFKGKDSWPAKRFKKKNPEYYK